MYQYLVVIEKANGNYSAYPPDLLGCIATGDSLEEVQKNMHEAIEMHTLQRKAISCINHFQGCREGDGKETE